MPRDCSWVLVLLVLLLMGYSARSKVIFPGTARASLQVGASPKTEIRELKIGQPLQQDWQGGKGDWYEMELSSGQFFHAVLEQNSLDLQVRVLDPANHEVIVIDSFGGIRGNKPVLIVAQASGKYQMEVRARRKDSPAGRYVIRVEEARPAAQEDYRRVQAYKYFFGAERIRSRGGTGSLKRALRSYSRALELMQADDLQAKATTLRSIGEIYSGLSDLKQAVSYNNLAIPLLKQAGDFGALAYALYENGLDYSRLGRRESALECLAKARQRMAAAGDKSGEAATLIAMGAAFPDSEKERTLEHFKDAEALLEQSDLWSEAERLGQIAEVYSKWGDLDKAMEYFTRSLLRYQTVSSSRGEAQLLNSLAEVYIYVGDSERALRLLDRALKLALDLHDASAKAAVLSNFGQLYDSLGNNNQAISYYRRAVRFAASAGDLSTEAAALLGLSEALTQKDPKAAVRCLERARKLRVQLYDPAGEADVLSHLGGLYGAQKKHQKALEVLNFALNRRKTAQDLGGQAETLTDIAETYLAMKRHEKAIEYFDQSLSITKVENARAENLAGIAYAQRQLGNLTEASASIERALDITEAVRDNSPGRQLRASYFASVQGYYQLQIQLLMELHKADAAKGYAVKALQASERARARNLLEVLSKSPSGGSQPGDRLSVQREQALQAQIDHVMDSLRKVNAEPEKLVSKRELDRLALEKLKLETTLRKQRYAATVLPAMVDPEELGLILGRDTLLLEYFLGDERSYVWAVSDGRVASFDLPRRREIEKAVRNLLDLLNARNSGPKEETEQQKQARVAPADAKVPRAARVLSKMALSPVIPLLGSKRLVIVSDGALQYVPFPMLPVAEESKLAGPLVARHEIVMLPSIAVLKSLRMEKAERKPAPKLLAVFADPPITLHDPRMVGKPAHQPALLPRPVRMQGRCVQEIDVGRLAFTQREAASILELVPRDQRMAALGFDATLGAATGSEVRNYRIVHFASRVYGRSMATLLPS